MTNMVYVAEDPKQPGAAWAICVVDPDDAKWQKEVAKSCADWVKRGAILRYVTHEQGSDMIRKWVRPEKDATAAEQTPSLF